MTGVGSAVGAGVGEEVGTAVGAGVGGTIVSELPLSVKVVSPQCLSSVDVEADPNI